MISLAADAYSLQQAYSSGDVEGAGQEALSMAAGLVPLKTIGKLPARYDWGGRKNGTFKKNWKAKKDLQNFVSGKSKDYAAESALTERGC